MNACGMCGEPLPGTDATCAECTVILRRDMRLLDARRVLADMLEYGASDQDCRQLYDHIKRLEGEK